MPVTGVESIVYGVSDLDECARFFTDFGLDEPSRDGSAVEFAMPDRTRIVLRHESDPELPAHWYEGVGVRQIVFGVDDQEALDELSASLPAEAGATVDDDGTVRFVDPNGTPYGLRVFTPELVVCPPEDLNAPGHVGRLNRSRRWYEGATPKGIQHVVVRVPDPAGSFGWMREYLGLQLTDVSRGLGLFGRFPGSRDHHNLFLMQANVRPGTDPGWDHVCLVVEDIDELMAGANRMERRGWESQLGVGRHRISSALFFYVECPAGGAVEYGCDTDVVDDEWTPRVFEPSFGYLTWTGRVPPFLPTEAAWDMEYVGDVEDHITPTSAS